MRLFLNGKQKDQHPYPTPQETHTIPLQFFLNLEFVICSLQILKKNMESSLFVSEKPPCPHTRPSYFLARVVNA